MSDAVAADQLRLHIEAVETLEEQKRDVADEIKDRFALAKAEGFDTKAMRAVIKLRRMEQHDRDEAEALLEIYKDALGLG